MTLVRRPGLLVCAMLVACGRGGGTSGEASAARGREPDRASAPDASARSAPGGSAELRDPVPLKVTAEVGGRRAAYTGMGECHHTTDASIYDVPATMWSAHVTAQSGDLSYLNLTLWQPKGSSDTQVTLNIALGGESHDVATVKGSSPKGSGSGRADAKGGGGSLRVEGKDAGGSVVHVSVECERWTEPVAEGG